MVFSVIIATYRRAAAVRRLISCLERQVFSKEEFEVILISDGPDPELDQFLKRSPRPQFHLRSKFLGQNHGPAYARNMGAGIAAGPYLVFTDDDCEPSPVWLSEYYKAIQLCPESVFTGGVIVPLDSRPTDYARNTAGLETAEFLTANCMIPAVIFRKAGKFDPRFLKAWREDSDLHLTLLEKGYQVMKVPAALVVHPVREAPWGVSISEQKKSMYDALLFKKHRSLYRSHIAAGPPAEYYLTLLAVALCFALPGKAVFAGLAMWLVFYLRFLLKRLKGNSLALRHISEMTWTSLIIPFLSVYWRVRGAFKFKVLFL